MATRKRKDFAIGVGRRREKKKAEISKKGRRVDEPSFSQRSG